MAGTSPDLSAGLRWQAIADGKKTVADEDILALLGDEANQEDKLWDLIDLQVGSLDRTKHLGQKNAVRSSRARS